MRHSSKKSGFTLIELLVVIAIISLLASIVLASVVTARKKAQLSGAAQSLQQVANALEEYQVTSPVVGLNSCSNIEDTFDQPNFTTALQTLVGKYISKLPVSPFPDDGNNHGLVYGYESCASSYTKATSGDYFTCGNTPWGNYTIYAYDEQQYDTGGNTQYDLTGQMQPQHHYYWNKVTQQSTLDPTEDGSLWCTTGS